MLREQLDVEFRDLADATRELATTKIAAMVDTAERVGGFVPEIRDALASMGLLGLVVPESRGGVDSDVRHQVVVLEELSRIYPSASTYLTAHWLATKIIARHATGAWADELLERCASGQALGAIAVTEPDAGSDLASVTTRARPTDEGDWVLDGTKRFITNGGSADFYTVLARTGGPGSRGLSFFAVEADTPGVSAARLEEKMGLHGSATAEMLFDSVRVPGDRLIGEEGKGFTYAMEGFDEGRLGVAAMSLGTAQGALDAATRYAAERRQFGHPIAHFQGVQFLVADMAIGVNAARSLVYDAAAAFVAGSPDAARLAAIAKTFASDMAMSVTSDGVQVHGGSGYVRDFPVEMLMRDAKINQIYEGTNQVLRMVIARTYLGDAAR